MTHTTEQERAQALAEKHGATSYRNRADTKNPAFGFTLAQLAALIADVEQAARRAPAVPVPVPVPQDAMDAEHWAELHRLRVEVKRSDGTPWQTVAAQERVECSRLRAMLAAAPQPPEGGCSVSNGETTAVPVHSVLARAKELHEKGFMPWTEAEQLALDEAGIEEAQLDELIGNCANTTLTSLLEKEDVREFVRSILVHQPLAAAPQPPEGKMISCACGDEFPVDSYGAGFLDAKGRCFGCDAATDAAPVQLTEPQAEIEVRSMATYLDLSIHEWRDTLPDGTYNVYTEQQVRQLLAAQQPLPH